MESLTELPAPMPADVIAPALSRAEVVERLRSLVGQDIEFSYPSVIEGVDDEIIAISVKVETVRLSGVLIEEGDL